MKFIR